MSIERFPMRHAHVVWLLRETSGAWLVLGPSAGWLHGSYAAALADARWMSANLGLPIRYREAAA